MRPPNSSFSDLLVAGVEEARQAQAAQKPNKIAAGLYALITRRGDMYFLADCTVNIEPSAEDLNRHSNGSESKAPWQGQIRLTDEAGARLNHAAFAMQAAQPGNERS